jgi:AraC-like DNA-binding protein
MKPKELVSCLIDYINNNINRFVSIDELALYFGYDKAYMMRLFKKHIGLTIKEYQNNRRIINSIKGIYNNDRLLKVALENGFNSLEYYSETFTNVVGVSPSTYRKYLRRKCSNENLLKIHNFFNSLRELNVTLIKYRIYSNKVLRIEKKK